MQELMKQIAPAQIAEMLQQIHLSQINIQINWYWESGIQWKIGDHNRYIDHGEDFQNIREAMSALAYRVAWDYPDSPFARWYQVLR